VRNRGVSLAQQHIGGHAQRQPAWRLPGRVRRHDHISASPAWAVGACDGWSSALIEHWNGKTWAWHLPQ
jgi:hypothetical protein